MVPTKSGQLATLYRPCERYSQLIFNGGPKFELSFGVFFTLYTHQEKLHLDTSKLTLDKMDDGKTIFIEFIIILMTDKLFLLKSVRNKTIATIRQAISDGCHEDSLLLLNQHHSPETLVRNVYNI